MTGSMHIRWIGTGSGLNPTLGNTSFLVKGTDSARTLLVDCGATVPLELMKTKDIGMITDVLITHAHADHIGGLEGLGFMHYFGLKRRDENRPNLYVANEDFAQRLWEHSLKGGMEYAQADDGTPFDATLDTYFAVHPGTEIMVPGVPRISLFPTQHVQHMENYGLRFENGVFYSGDSTELPQTDARIIFQDCQFFESGPADVHISYAKLKRELSDDVRAKIHLVHLGGGYETRDPRADGFAGFVMPGQEFHL